MRAESMITGAESRSEEPDAKTLESWTIEAAVAASPEHQQIVARIALQEYNAVETAAMLNMTPKTVLRRYGWALDHLTRILLDAGMLRAMNSCQGGQTVENSPSC